MLNAFRHQRFNTAQTRRSKSSLDVLNAFRHQRFNTRGTGNHPDINHRRAQRLSASEIQHKPPSSANSVVLNVLNAFRHQRFNTQNFEVAHAFRSCAQRLSASEIQHLATIIPASVKESVLNAFRHQRFNTVRVDAQLSILRVLNAFRHQRFNTYHLLLIAKLQICAQRLSASEIQHKIGHNPNVRGFQCSTPFGIRDSTQIESF